MFKKVKEALGFGQCRIIVVGAAPINCETLEFFMTVDVPLLELYGMSESTGPQTVNVREFTRWRTGSCGKNISGVETKIDNPDEHGDGEVSDVLSDIVYDTDLCDDIIYIIATPTNYCLLIVWTMTMTLYTERSLIKKP